MLDWFRRGPAWLQAWVTGFNLMPRNASMPLKPPAATFGQLGRGLFWHQMPCVTVARPRLVGYERAPVPHLTGTVAGRFDHEPASLGLSAACGVHRRRAVHWRRADGRSVSDRHPQP